MAAISHTQFNADSVSSDALLPSVPRALYAYSFAAVLGILTVLPAVRNLWQLWTSDALKSIGMFVPPVCFVLILRAWRSIGWKSDGTWYGLALILLNAGLGWLQLHSILLLVISPRWTTVIPPASLPLVIYAAGAALLLGGTRLLRAALFPICALWLANPVPRAFSAFVDLPLQTVSAHIARAFAMHLGQPLTPDHLRLMFTPEFGMFIAPGCNGVRGSVTMALIALIAGHLYRFRWYKTAAIVPAAMLLGYVFNLLRLCALVLYYIVALHLPWLQDKAETGDYIIGAVLFLCASFLLFTVIQHMRDSVADLEPVLHSGLAAKFGYARPAALVLIACITGAGFISASNVRAEVTRTAEQRFPERIGSFKIVRTWAETTTTGAEIYEWAEYAPPVGTSVAIGIAPGLSWHDPIICHAIRGEHPVWQGPIEVATASRRVNFNSALYSDGIVTVLDASTQCSTGGCDEFAMARKHLGLVYSSVDRSTLLGRARSLPVLVRAELPSSSTGPDDALRNKLASAIQSFVASADLAALTRP